MKYLKKGNKYYEVSKEVDRGKMLNNIRDERISLKAWQKQAKKRIDDLYQSKLDVLKEKEDEISLL